MNSKEIFAEISYIHKWTFDAYKHKWFSFYKLFIIYMTKHPSICFDLNYSIYEHWLYELFKCLDEYTVLDATQIFGLSSCYTVVVNNMDDIYKHNLIETIGNKSCTNINCIIFLPTLSSKSSFKTEINNKITGLFYEHFLCKHIDRAM